MNTKALWITGIAVIVIIILILKGGVAPRVQPAPTDQTGVPTGKLPAGSQAPGDPKALVGTWVWQKTVMLDGEVVTPQKPGVFALTLTSDGKASGKTDCNGFGGEYMVGSDGVLSFGPFMSTMMYCEGSQEGHFNGLLSTARGYMFDAQGNLVVSVQDGAGTMIFAKQ